jgi:phosphoenolpyruvate carboxykinase (ATP)
MATLETKKKTLPCPAKNVLWNPSRAELRKLIERMPNCRVSRYQNVNVQTKVLARSKKSTFVVTDRPQEHSDQTISVAKGAEMAKRQDDYLAARDVIVIEGYIGDDPKFRVPARLVMEAAFPNVAAMQKTLYFPATPAELERFEPAVTVIYTPGLPASGYPDDRLIAVDLAKMVTRVFNSDYFGESKKGGLRMWNKLVYDRGGLPMHSGAKIVPVGAKKRTMLIVGLSGTGKTTTTFTRQNGSSPVQDDFVALLPDGRVGSTENGCFAKTFGLDPKFEPTIHAAVCHPDAYLENVSQKGDGELDFFDTSYTQNGRSVFAMERVDGYLPASNIQKADVLLILNRNENIVPAVCRISGSQAAAFFMLGETKGTSAGGAEEAGKFLRIPGTNPFFPLLHSMQGNRFLELQKRIGLEVYVMNTGRVGGGEDEKRSKKVKIPHSSAIVKAIAEGTIVWEKDPDFGYDVAKSVPGVEASDADLLQPRKLYAAQGRGDEYKALVEKTKKDRTEYLKKWPGLDATIVDSMK